MDHWQLPISHFANATVVNFASTAASNLWLGRSHMDAWLQCSTPGYNLPCVGLGSPLAPLRGSLGGSRPALACTIEHSLELQHSTRVVRPFQPI